MKLKPVQQKRVYQDIIEQIKASIESGELKPGEKLPSERELANMLSVSRTAIREAISVMASAGVVEIFRGIGVFLKEDENDKLLRRINELFQQKGINLVELLEVRQGIEGQAAYLAAIRRTESDLQKIKFAYKKMEDFYAGNQTAEKEDFEFHTSIVKATQNKMLLQSVKLFSNEFLQEVKQLRNKSIITGKSQEVLSEHLDIYEAIEKQAPENAQKAMLEHLNNANRRYFGD